MKSVEATGKTILEATESALLELGKDQAQCTVLVLAEPTRGFLGIGSKDARVRVTYQPSRAELAKDFLAGVLTHMEMEAAIEIRPRGDTLNLDIVGRDMGILIGRRGDTLKALDLLANLAASKGAGEVERVVVDISGYRKRRESELEDMARSLKMRVTRTGESAKTVALDARDRRVVHVTLQDDPDVMTHSEGEEPFRRVVVSPKA